VFWFLISRTASAKSALPQSARLLWVLRSARIEAHSALFLEFIERRSDITLAEIQTELAKAGVAAGIGTIWRFFDDIGSRAKKTAYAAERDRLDIQRRRWEWSRAGATSPRPLGVPR
jgi:hypothetical protein